MHAYSSLGLAPCAIFGDLTLMLGKFLTVLRVCSQQKGVTSTGIALMTEIVERQKAGVEGRGTGVTSPCVARGIPPGLVGALNPDLG